MRSPVSYRTDNAVYGGGNKGFPQTRSFQSYRDFYRIHLPAAIDEARNGRDAAVIVSTQLLLPSG